MASSEGVQGKGLSSEGVGPGSLTTIQCACGQHKLNLFSFVFYLGGSVVTRVREQTWEGLEMSVLGYMM